MTAPTRPETIAKKHAEWLYEFFERKGIEVGGMMLGHGSAAVWVPGAGNPVDLQDDFDRWQREQEKRSRG